MSTATPAARADLLALTADGLAALANRGLVKRAVKELDAGTVPTLDIGPDGTVRAVFPDGTETALPADGGLQTATCTCAAAGKCRHRVAAVLAYQRAHQAIDSEAPAEPGAVASPAAITDDRLREAFSRHALNAAERTRKQGFTARLTPPGADRPAVAELPGCTVSFLVPGELGYVHSDAVGPSRDVGVVLAVWAFRELAEGGDAPVTVAVGGGDTAPAVRLDAAATLAERLLLSGVAGADEVLGASLTRAVGDLVRARLHWPAATLTDLIDQTERHRDRSASYDPRRLAALIAELEARRRASRTTDGTPNSEILGTSEVDKTPLSLVRLTALGCRVGADGEKRTLEVYLAHPETGVVLTLRRSWAIPEDKPLDGNDLAGRRIAGCRVRDLASGNVVSEAASRNAARALNLGTGRLAATQVLPLGGAWDDLPDGLRVTDPEALAERLAARPPGLIRPRVAAESVHVLVVEAVTGAGYDPATQTFTARLRAPGGGAAVLRAVHRASSPGALEAIEAALEAGPKAVAGVVHRESGGLVVEPTAVLTENGLVVPDLAAGDDRAELAAAVDAERGPLEAAVEEALEACADAAHRGLRQVREPSRRRLEAAAARLDRIGLGGAAAALRALHDQLRKDDDADMVRAWHDAYIRLLVTEECR